MDNQAITMILVAFFGALITLLLGVVASLAMRNANKMDEVIDKHSIALSSLDRSINELSSIIKSIEMRFLNAHAVFERTFKDHHESIEGLRERTLSLGNKVAAMQMQGELKNGWILQNNNGVSK